MAVSPTPGYGAAPGYGPASRVPPLPPGYEYHVFITYRRMGGKNYLASLFCKALESHGYKVFLDVRSLQGGVFDSKILESLRASCCDVFILVDGTLERCKELEDWVRREIAEACHLGKAIIPVVDDPQERFPSTAGLPPDMANFPRHNALFFHNSMQEECIARLCSHIDAAVANTKPFASLPAPLPPPTPAAGKRSPAASSDASDRSPVKAGAAAAPIQTAVNVGASNDANGCLIELPRTD
eukprot:tig00020528_g9991.t1